MAKYEIWNNGIECGKDVANTGSNIKEIWNQGVLWWKKGSDKLWNYCGQTTLPIGSSNSTRIVGSTSLLICSSSLHYANIKNQKAYLLTFVDGDYSASTIDLTSIDYAMPTQNYATSIYVYLNGYFYISNTYAFLNNHVVLRISEQTGIAELLENYDLKFYVNNSLFTDVISYTYSNFSNNFNLDIFSIEVYKTGHSNRRTNLIFRTNDFLNFYASDVLYDSTLYKYYQNVYFASLSISNAENNKVSPNAFADIGNVGSGFIVYYLSNASLISTSPYTPAYSDMEIAYTEDFIHFDTIYTKSEIIAMSDSGSYPHKGTNRGSYFPFIYYDGSDWVTVYFMSEDYYSSDAMDFNASDIGAYSIWNQGAYIPNVPGRAFHGYSFDGSSTHAVLATTNIRNELQDYEEIEELDGNMGGQFYSFDDYTYFIEDIGSSSSSVLNICARQFEQEV